MKELSLREHQLCMLNILLDFQKFCNEHGLTFFLDAGTLLGAVRHKGFIPWDNDADICMLRPDFNIFMDLMAKNDYRINDHLILEKPEDTIYTFYKIGDTRTKLIEFPDKYPIECYVYVDLFVKEGIKDRSRKSKKLCNLNTRLSLLHWFLKFSIPSWKKNGGFFKKFIAHFADLFVKNKNFAFYKQNSVINKNADKNPIDQCEYLVTLANGEWHRMCKRSLFDRTVSLDFEGYKFCCPAGYDEWLTTLYGNSYMELPPENKRSEHTIKVFSVE